MSTHFRCWGSSRQKGQVGVGGGRRVQTGMLGRQLAGLEGEVWVGGWVRHALTARHPASARWCWREGSLGGGGLATDLAAKGSRVGGVFINTGPDRGY